MPRTNGVYSPPAGTKGVPNTTVRSAPYNSFVDDLTQDANAARPISAGGTGANSATQARENLGALASADIIGAGTKATPIDGDGVVITDSEDSGKLKRVLWSRVKAVLKAYFDGLYLGLGGGTLTGLLRVRSSSASYAYNVVKEDGTGNLGGLYRSADGLELYLRNTDESLTSILRATGNSGISSSLTVSGSNGLTVSGTGGITASGTGGITASNGAVSSTRTINGFAIGLQAENKGSGDIALRMASANRGFEAGTHIEVGQRANGDLFLWNGAGVQVTFTKSGALRSSGDVEAGGSGWVYSGSSGGSRSTLRPTTVVAGGTGTLFADGNLQGSKWEPWGSSYAFEAIGARIEDRGYWRTQDYLLGRNVLDLATYTICSKTSGSWGSGDPEAGSVIRPTNFAGGTFGVFGWGTWKSMLGVQVAANTPVLTMRIA